MEIRIIVPGGLQRGRRYRIVDGAFGVPFGSRIVRLRVAWSWAVEVHEGDEDYLTIDRLDGVEVLGEEVVI